MTFTPKMLTDLAYFFTNTDRAALEQAGIIQQGKAGDEKWKRYNHNFDIFILKSDEPQLAALAKLANDYAGSPQTVTCPCTTFEQDESCPIGAPSLLCSVCSGTGNAAQDKVVALAAEMLKVAAQVDELEDPFAAWETIDLIKSQNGQLRKSLKLAEGRLSLLLEAYPDESGTIDHPSATRYVLEQIRAALATTEGSDR